MSGICVDVGQGFHAMSASGCSKDRKIPELRD